MKYDGNKSGTLVLTDEFGNKVIPFTVSIEVEEEDVPAEIPEEPSEDVEIQKKLKMLPEEEPIVENPDEGVSEEGQAEEVQQLVDETDS